MRILVLGVTGMLGSAVFRVLSGDQRHETWGSLRDASGLRHYPEPVRTRLVTDVDVLGESALLRLFERVRPDMVVNGTGIVKQLAEAKDPLRVLPMNAMFPHRLAAVADLAGARMVQLSTDCVFSGRRGLYTEDDLCDAEDLYGKSKSIGEVRGRPHVLTLRTSGIGHELGHRLGLLEWFLGQEGRVKGFSKAIYSGLTSVELGRVIRDVVLPRPELSGLYQVSSAPISKLELLKLIAQVYGKSIEIVPDSAVAVDRSLDGSRFAAATGYRAPAWPELIQAMKEERQSHA